MDWYLRKESDDLVVPNYREALEAPCADDRSPSPADWCQWGFNRSGKPRSPNKYRCKSTKPTVEEFDFDRQGPYFQVNTGPSDDEREGSNSSARGQPPFVDSARTSEASFYGQQDFQMQNSVDWTDEIFLSSLLEEDHGNMENPLESLDFPDSIYSSLSFENLLTNMPVDPQSLMDPARGETSVATCSYPLFTNDISEAWGKMEDSSPSCLILEESKRSEGSVTDHDLTALVPAELSPLNEDEAVADVDKPKCLEAMVLRQLEGVMIQLSDKTRICFRDALYRLAKSSKQNHTINQSRAANFINRPGFAEVGGESSSLGRSGCAESKTNVIDRTIANLMFKKPCFFPPELSCAGSHHRSMEDLASSGSYYSLQ